MFSLYFFIFCNSKNFQKLKKETKVINHVCLMQSLRHTLIKLRYSESWAYTAIFWGLIAHILHKPHSPGASVLSRDQRSACNYDNITNTNFYEQEFELLSIYTSPPSYLYNRNSFTINNSYLQLYYSRNIWKLVS